MQKNILVTGGAGFIGSHLCDKLLSNKHKVIAIDNFNDFYPRHIKETNIKHCKNNPNFTLYETDIRSENIAQIFKEHKPDCVIHLAAMAGVQPSIKKPMLYEDVNVKGTMNILENMKISGTKKLLFASSSSIYGNNRNVPFCENDVVDFPISPYAATKKAGELLCHTYHHLNQIDVICLRFFTVYGPRQRPDLAIHKFARLMTENKSIPFFGDGSSSRDYTFVEDIIQGVDQALLYILGHSDVYEIINLGENTTVTLSTMVDTLQKQLNTEAILNKMPFQEGDVQTTYASIEKAKKLLSYNPKTNFENGIEQFLKWFREHNSIL